MRQVDVALRLIRPRPAACAAGRDGCRRDGRGARSALAGSRARKDAEAVRQQAASCMRAAWGIGAAAALGLALLAAPINLLLYADDAGSRTFALVGCTALAGTVNAAAAAALQGLGAVRAPALLMLGAAVLKAAFNAALVPASARPAPHAPASPRSRRPPC